MEFKILKTSEEKEFKSKQKRPEKKRKAAFESEAKLNLVKRDFDKRKGKLDENKNESTFDNLEEDNTTVYTASIPTENSFDVLSLQDPANNDIGNVETVEQTLHRVEAEIRGKMKVSVNRKVEAKKNEGLLTNENTDDFEKEIIEEMEEIILEQLSVLRHNLESVQHEESIIEDYDHDDEEFDNP